MTNQEINSEQRQFNRIAFDAPVTVYGNGNEWQSKLVDISLKGALIQRPDNWNPGNIHDFTLSIQLADNELEINMEVTLAHTEEEQLGFHCRHIDLDSITTLKRLVELNLGDEQLLNRDFENLLHQ